MRQWIGGLLGITIGIFVGNQVGGLFSTVVIVVLGGLAGYYLGGRLLARREE